MPGWSAVLWLLIVGVATQPVRGTQMQTTSALVNGVEYHYLEAGEGDLVVALHGFPDNAHSYRHQMKVLAEAGYRVVAPFLRGYSPTGAAPDGNYTVPAIAMDVSGLIEQLSPSGRAIVIGHDWGAAVAHTLAAAVPESVEKLVTMAVPFGGGFAQSLVANPEQQRRSWYMFFFQMPFAEAAVMHDDYAFIEQLWREWSPGWAFEADALDSVKRTLASGTTLGAALGYYRQAFSPPDPGEELAAFQKQIKGTIDVPTLYLHGALDGCIGWEVADGMEQHFPAGLEKILVEGVGHFLHQEQPETVNRYILEFLGAD